MTGLLQNHIAAITGAGSGIGRAIALGLRAREGERGRARHQRRGGGREHRRADRRCRRQGDRLTLDVTDRDACRAVAAQSRSEGRQRLDPGQRCRHHPAQCLHRRCRTPSRKDWDDILDVNLNGMFNVTHAFLAQLRATKGRIVNLGSIQSFVHLRTPSSTAYTTSKHGVLGFTKALAAELGKEGVRVNAIGPGFIETRDQRARCAPSIPSCVKMFLDHTPLGRAGKPEDIVGPAIFLASDLVGLRYRLDPDGRRRLSDGVKQTRKPRLPTPSRTVRRGALIAGLMLLVIGIDAATGFNLIMAGGCVTLFMVQLVAMTAGTVVIVAGLVVWIFSRFNNDKALYFVFGALALNIAVFLIKNAVILSGVGCID